MIKDQRIQKFIQKVIETYGNEIVEVVDYWDADLCAIGFKNKAKPQKLVYVSNYGVRSGFYDYELEEALGTHEEDYQVLGAGEAIDENSLLEKIQTYLNLKLKQ